MMNRGRLKLIAVGALFLGPLFAAFVWYYFLPQNFAPRTTTNHAKLITPPAPLTDFANYDIGGNRISLHEIKRKWTIVHMIEQPCAADCQKFIYHTRQVRLALGRDQARVRRIFIADKNLAENLIAAHRDVVFILPGARGMEQQIQRVLRQTGLTQTAAVLIDPLGNVVLGIAADLPPKLLLKDLKKLLRLSRIG